MRFFSADHHFGHTKTNKWSERPFTNHKEGDAALLENHNAVVSEDDDYYFLGDFIIDPKFYFFLEMMDFHHCFFILGNHDREEELRKKIASSEYLQDRVTIVREMTIEIAGVPIFLVHKPLHASTTMRTLCGHVHNRWLMKHAGAHYVEHSKDSAGRSRQFQYPVLNVGVDMHDYKPISEHEIAAIFGLSAQPTFPGISSAV